MTLFSSLPRRANAGGCSITNIIRPAQEKRVEPERLRKLYIAGDSSVKLNDNARSSRATSTQRDGCRELGRGRERNEDGKSAFAIDLVEINEPSERGEKLAGKSDAHRFS